MKLTNFRGLLNEMSNYDCIQLIIKSQNSFTRVNQGKRRTWNGITSGNWKVLIVSYQL